MMSALSCILPTISGEFILKKRPNGGGVILFRTILSSSVLYLIMISVTELVNPKTVMEFSFAAFRSLLVEKISWFGAMFAAIYAALYARFSSQWTYLAGVYNSYNHTVMTCKLDESNKNILKAAYVLDAYYLHLAAKPMFAQSILQFLENGSVEYEVKKSLKTEKFQELCTLVGHPPAPAKSATEQPTDNTG